MISRTTLTSIFSTRTEFSVTTALLFTVSLSKSRTVEERCPLAQTGPLRTKKARFWPKARRTNWFVFKEGRAKCVRGGEKRSHFRRVRTEPRNRIEAAVAECPPPVAADLTAPLAGTR